MSMGKYRMSGSALYNSHHQLVAKARGESLFDSDNQRVGFIKGNILFDPEDRKMMTLRGSDIYNAANERVASLAEVNKSIIGSVEGIMSAALWYCFVR
jgi:hypothetical protein